MPDVGRIRRSGCAPRRYVCCCCCCCCFALLCSARLPAFYLTTHPVHQRQKPASHQDSAPMLLLTRECVLRSVSLLFSSSLACGGDSWKGCRGERKESCSRASSAFVVDRQPSGDECREGRSQVNFGRFGDVASESSWSGEVGRSSIAGRDGRGVVNPGVFASVWESGCSSSFAGLAEFSRQRCDQCCRYWPGTLLLRCSRVVHFPS